MLFNDGWWYVDPDAAVRGAVVQDNLAASGDVPPMVSVFVDPGVLVGADDGEPRKSRNVEHDAFDARYADLLLDEVVPATRLAGTPPC